MNVGRPCILRGWSTLPFKICRRRLYDIRLCLPANVSNWRDIFIYLAIRKSAQVPDAVTRTCEIWHNFARTQDSLHELELIGSSSRNLKRACNNQSKLASVCTSLCLSTQAQERLHEFVFIDTSSRGRETISKQSRLLAFSMLYSKWRCAAGCIHTSQDCKKLYT